MKTLKIILLSFLLFSIADVYSQFDPQRIGKYDVLDTSRLRVSYSVDYLFDSSNVSHVSKDILFLDIGKTISKSYSYLAFKTDSLLTYTDVGDGLKYAFGALPYDIYKYYQKETVTVHYRAPISNNVFTYSDDYCRFNWEITPDKKTVLGYACQKAITNFRGRDWEVWFTMEIPMSDGPWKFCGLPGLILEASDSKKNYIFKATGIENRKKPIVMCDWIFEKTTRKKLDDLLRKASLDVKAYYENVLGISYRIIDQNGNELDIKKVPKPYNPIELE